MASSFEDDCEWSEERYSLKQIINDVGLPTVVRVSEGIYSRNESETFSCGDLLKLDFVKTILKVSAKFITSKYDDDGNRIKEDDYGYLKWKDDILIPLGYNGKLQIVGHDYKKFHSVSGLIHDFPRFVRADKPIRAKNGKSETITINSGSRLELDRLLPGEGLVCIYKHESVVLDIRTKGSFVLLPDETFYTLQEVVDKLPLPQCIRFVDAEFNKVMTTDLTEALENVTQFKGPLQLQRTVTQKVVVGHHKPSGPSIGDSKFCKRSLVLLPLDSENVNSLEFQVPLYRESDEYQLLMARNFSDIGVTDIDGGLYLEFAKNPKVHMIREVHEVLASSLSEVPPPVPPRSYQFGSGRDAKSTVPYRRQPPAIPEEQPVYEIEEDTTPVVPRRDKHPVFKSQSSQDKPEEPEPEYPVLADLEFKLPPNSAEGKHLSGVPQKIRQQMKKMQNQLVKFVRSKSMREKSQKEAKDTPTTSPKSPQYLEQVILPGKFSKEKENKAQKSPIKNTSNQGDNDNDPPEYDYPDFSELQISKQKEHGIRRDVERPAGPNFVSVVSVSSSTRAPPNLSQGQPTQTSKKPSAAVQPQISRPPRNPGSSVHSPMQSQATTTASSNQSSDFNFEKLSVDEVVKRLKLCGLNRMAEICKHQVLDGAILNNLSEDELKSEFGLVGIDMIKFNKFKEAGWVPRLG